MSLVADRTYRVDFPILSENGRYHFTVLPAVLDVESVPLDQDADGIPGEAEDEYSFLLILDAVPPRITNHTLAGDIADTVNHVDIWFSETIDKTTFTTADVSIVKPNNQTVAATTIEEVGFNRFRVTFAEQTLVGQYNVKVGPNIADLAGNLLDQDRDGQAGETADDVYDATFNVVEVDLGLTNLVVDPVQLWAGEPTTVSWSGSNRTGVPLLGNWIDAVYLSTDDKWDIGDALLATVPHTGGLAENESYSGSANVLIPGTLPGNYRILVRADVASQQRETNESDNLVASKPLVVTIRVVPTTGAPVSGTLTENDRADYYAIHVSGGEAAGIVLDGHAATGTNELYVSFEAIPTRQDFDYRVIANETETDHQDRQIAVSAPPGGGTFYVLVYGEGVSNAMPYDITASTGPFVVTSITPDRGSNRLFVPSGGKPLGRVIPSTITVSGGRIQRGNNGRVHRPRRQRPPSGGHSSDLSVRTHRRP